MINMLYFSKLLSKLADLPWAGMHQYYKEGDFVGKHLMC